ncbi:hypothetical protein NFI96_004772 [Prochilodus magdalenae]|nr:hypothetical protein NFI96_004772 [Prochilodus magdalenae]
MHRTQRSSKCAPGDLNSGSSALSAGGLQWRRTFSPSAAYCLHLCLQGSSRKNRHSEYEKADPNAKEDTYTALQPTARSSDDVYHTLGAVQSGSPDDTYTALDPQSLSSPEYETLAVSSSQLSDVMKKDEHRYCFRIITNDEKERWVGKPGVQLRVTDLHVEAPEEVTEGQTAVLTCRTTCSLTDPTFIWYKNGRPLTTKTIKNNQLHLQTVSSEDAGSYSCAVREYQHLRSTAQNLRVRYPPKSVSVSISPPGEIVEGSSVTLTCSSDGNSPVKIYTWFRGSTPVGNGETYNIPNIRSEHSGEYTCQGRNEHREGRSTAVQINVLYPPKKVSVSISGETVEGSSAILTCSSDANPPVKNYTWFKEGGASPVGSGHSYSITNITAEHTGLYYCENEHGAQNGSVVVTVESQHLLVSYLVWAAVGVGGGCIILLLVLSWIYGYRMKTAAGADSEGVGQNEVLYATITRAKGARAAAEVQDQVSSIGLQGEPIYDNVTVHYHHHDTSATGLSRIVGHL